MTKNLSIAVLTLSVSACSVFGGKAAEEPNYSVISQDGKFEIRQYQPYAIAETYSDGTYDKTSDIGFNRLFDYISGENQAEQNISMTAPVLQEPQKGTEIKMTAPVLQERKEKGWSMAFVLPEQYNAENAPKPNDDRITIKQVEGKKLAVKTFSGWMGAQDIKSNAKSLKKWLDDNGYEYKPEYKSAGYNPPFTLPMFRRNEVMIEVKD